MFASIDVAASVALPVHIMHGTADTVVPCWHGRELHRRLPHSLAPLWIEGAGHNDLGTMTFRQLFEHIRLRIDDILLWQRDRAAAEARESDE